MINEELFQVDLIEIDSDYLSKDDIFNSVSDYLHRSDYTYPSFYQALHDREEIYPTGLALEHINIAIPHTDVEHVKRPFVYFVKLKEPCQFIQMGTTDEIVESKFVLILGIKDPHKQVGMLSWLMNTFSDKDVCKDILKAETSLEIKNILNSRMGEKTYEKSYRSVR